MHKAKQGGQVETSGPNVHDRLVDRRKIGLIGGLSIQKELSLSIFWKPRVKFEKSSCDQYFLGCNELETREHALHGERKKDPTPGMLACLPLPAGASPFSPRPGHS